MVGGILLGDWLAHSSPSLSSLDNGHQAQWLWSCALVLGLCALLCRWWARTLESPRLRRHLDWRHGSERPLLWLGIAALSCSLHLWHEVHSPGKRLAAQIPPSGCTIEAEGIVIEEPGERGHFRVRLDTTTMLGRQQQAGAKVIALWPMERTGYMKRPVVDISTLPRYGDRVRLKGMINLLQRTRNPGEFSKQKVWQREDIVAELSVRYREDAQIIGHDEGHWLIARSLELRHWMERTLAQGIEDEPEIVAVLESIVLGTQSDTPQELFDLFRYTGTIHLFSVSGLHVAMVAALSLFLFQALGVPRRWMLLAVLPMLWGYAFITGLAAATVRATTMATIALLGVALYRVALPWNTLGLAAIVILAVDTQQLFRAGFQLSFLLVAALLVGVRPVNNRLLPLAQPDPFLPPRLWSRTIRARVWAWKHAAGALSVSLVAWVASIPLTLYYFRLFSPSSVPANLVAGVLSWVILALSLASAAAGVVCTWLSVTLNNANWLFTKALLGGLAFFANLPWAHRYVELPSVEPTPLCAIQVFDLAGGGATVLHLDMNGERRTWMLDCGSSAAFRWTVLPYLRERGVNRLDGVLLTHGDSAHISGSVDLLAEMPVGEVLDAPLRDRSLHRRKVHSLLAAGDRGKAIVRRGDKVTLAPGATLHILFPPSPMPPTGLPLRTADDKAIVARLDIEIPTKRGRHGELRGEPTVRRLLFTSDAGFGTEEWLRENAAAGELQADVVIKGRHTADYSGTPAFLHAVRPQLVVASGAPFPAEQRIDERWAAKLEASGVKLLRQDQSGAVRLAIDHDGTLRAHGFLDKEGYSFDGTSSPSSSSNSSISSSPSQ